MIKINILFCVLNLKFTFKQIKIKYCYDDKKKNQK